MSLIHQQLGIQYELRDSIILRVLDCDPLLNVSLVKRQFIPNGSVTTAAVSCVRTLFRVVPTDSKFIEYNIHFSVKNRLCSHWILCIIRIITLL